jgi:regulatory protein YycI of two-component signal transduction system YycFG
VEEAMKLGDIWKKIKAAIIVIILIVAVFMGITFWPKPTIRERERERRDS